MENGVTTDDKMTDVWSAVGNLIRIASVLEPREVKAACTAADLAPLHIMLLDPRHTPRTPRQHLLNRQLLAAFAEFRDQIEVIRRRLEADEAEEAKNLC